MKTRPKRIAVAAIVLLLITTGAWWWQRHSTVAPAVSSGSPAIDTPVVAEVMPRPGRAAPAGMPEAADAYPCGIAIRDAFNVRANQLGQRDDARSQLAYALALPVDTSLDLTGMDGVGVRRVFEERFANAQRALTRAAELAPEAPGVLFLAATACNGGDNTCRAVREALVEAEPENLAVWLYEMGWARMRNDREAGERAFEHAAKATRFDTYADATMHALVEAYGGMPTPVECSSPAAKAAMRRATERDQDFSMLDQAMMLAGASRAATLPAYFELRLRCEPRAGVDLGVATREGCRNILTKLADGDGWAARIIAVGTLVQLSADDPDAAVWRERYRQDRWIYAQQAQGDIERRMKPEDYVLDEGRSLQAALKASGRWPPPADWLPDDESSRSLILTGRPPPPKKPKPR